MTRTQIPGCGFDERVSGLSGLVLLQRSDVRLDMKVEKAS